MTIAPRPTPPRPGGHEAGRGGRIGLMVALIVLLLALIVGAAILMWSGLSGPGSSPPVNTSAPAAPTPGPDRTRDEDRAAAERARTSREADEAYEDEGPPPPLPEPPVDGTSPPRLISGSISSDDYPAAAIRAEAQGTTTIALQIGTDGRVSNCSVSGSSGSGALDAASCSLVQRRFRFAPAMQDGRPVPARVTRRITWRLPED